MKGRINFICDVAQNFGDPKENLESYVRFGELSDKDGLAVLSFHGESGYMCGKLEGKMFGVVKTPEKREIYKWKPRTEAA